MYNAVGVDPVEWCGYFCRPILIPVNGGQIFQFVNRTVESYQYDVSIFSLPAYSIRNTGMPAERWEWLAPFTHLPI